MKKGGREGEGKRENGREGERDVERERDNDTRPSKKAHCTHTKTRTHSGIIIGFTIIKGVRVPYSQ